MKDTIKLVMIAVVFGLVGVRLCAEDLTQYFYGAGQAVMYNDPRMVYPVTRPDEPYRVTYPKAQTVPYYYNNPRVVRVVRQPARQQRVIVRNPVIMPAPQTEVLIARPAQVEYYDQEALIKRGYEILRWNNGFPDPVTGYQCYWDPRLPGHNDPGVAFPQILPAQEMYGARW